MSRSTIIRTGGLLTLLLTLALSHVQEPPLTTAAPKSIRQPVENYNYYLSRPDLRRCAFPMCGGFFVRLVNQPRTRCADGRSMNECYVAEIDWNGQPSGEARAMLLRGDLIQRSFPRNRRFGVLRVNESWRAASERPPLGSFFRVKDLGIRCITHPCLTHQAESLNSLSRKKVAGVELNPAQASEDSVAAAYQAMTTSEGVLVAGTYATVTGPGGRAQTIKTTQFYLRASGPVAKKPCMKTGCGGQICSDEQVISTCEWRPEHECYRRARCERQANGECGFTPSRDLTACLKRR